MEDSLLNVAQTDDTTVQPDAATSAPASTPTESTTDAAATDQTNPSLLDESLKDESNTSTEKEVKAEETEPKKVEEDKKPEEKKEEAPKPKAPENYEDFKLPEGIDLPKDKAEEFKSVAKSLDLTQEQAQKLVDMQTRFAQTQQQIALEQYKQQVTTWRNEAIEALGPQYKQELAYVNKAVRQFGSQDFQKLMNDTGLGNHKDVLTFLNRVGKSISEDKFSEGKGRSATKSGAEILYPRS